MIQKFLPSLVFSFAVFVLAGPARLIAADAPAITTHPTNRTVLLGDSASFTVAATGTEPLEFQWFRNDVAIAGAIDALLTLGATTTNDDLAQFSVVVSNTVGIATSSNAVLRVDPGVIITLTNTVLAINGPWRYNQSGTDLGTAWRDVGYADGTWLSGLGPFDGKRGAAAADNPVPPACRGQISAAGVAINTCITLSNGSASAQIPAIYFRTHITNATGGGAVLGAALRLTTFLDDGAAFFLNGAEIYRLGLDAGASYATSANRTAGDAALEGPTEVTVTNLLPGDNVLAAEIHQVNLTSSDITFGLRVDALVTTRARDTQAPVIVSQSPLPGSIVRNLYQVEVLFSEPVNGVEASDLLINSVPATGITFGIPGQYLFDFAQPLTGVVQIAFASMHEITDQSLSANPFAGASWTVTLDTNLPTSTVTINEFLADNNNGLHDEDGLAVDWVELYNPGPAAVNLNGFSLTDQTNLLTKWRFPSVTMLADTYLIVYASGKNRTNNPAKLHTNFQLGAGGEYVALVDPATNIVSAIGGIGMIYPPQFEDVSYGRDRLDSSFLGYFSTVTPGGPNSTSGAGIAPEVEFSRPSGTFLSNAPFSLVLSTPVSNAVIYYALGTNVPGSNSTLYTSPIPIANTAIVRARAFGPGLLPGKVSTKTYIALSPGAPGQTYVSSVVNFTSSLPIMILHNFGRGAVPSGSDQFVVVQTFEPKQGISSLTNKPDLAEQGVFHLRGSSTLNYAKGSFFLEVRDEFGLDNNVPMLGLPEDSDWVLYAPNNFEPALMHNALAQDFARQRGPYSSRTRYVEVFLKDESGAAGPLVPGDYNGVYVLLEKIKIDQNRLDIGTLEPEHVNPPEVTGGYAFSIDRTAPGEQQLSAGGASLNWVDPKYRQIIEPARAPQMNYIRAYLNAFGTALSEGNWTNAQTGFAAYIDVDSWVGHHIHEVITFNVDALRLSGYLHKPRNQKLHYGPAWDYDRTQGSTDGRDANPRTWRSQSSPDAGTDFFNFSPWWGRLNSSPDFWQAWIDKYQALRRTVWSTPNVLATIEKHASQLRPIHPREVLRWNIQPRGANGSGAGTYETEIQWKKTWYTNRLSFADTNFLNPPSFGVPAGAASNGMTVTLAPASKPGSRVIYTLDGTDPRLSGGRISPSAFSNSGPVTLTISNNIRVFARSWNPTHANLSGANNPPISSPWSGPMAGTYYTSLPPLRITEIMYHPAAPAFGNTNDADNFEYLEVQNTSGASLNLNGFSLAGGVSFVFSNLTLVAGQSCVVVRDLAAFQSRYGTNVPGIVVAGVFAGNLANDGDHLVLYGPLQEPILDFDFDDDWYPITDGTGFSLVLVDPGAAVTTWGLPSSWRPSAGVSGSPGQTDPTAPSRPGVVVNEVLSFPNSGGLDVIELHNPTGTEANVRGWFLTDDLGEPMKFVIPADRLIPAGGFITINETEFNSVGPDGFGLDAEGDAVYLFSGDGTNLTGCLHGFDFGASAQEVTFGRHVISTGEDHLVAQRANSLDGANAGPLVGPILVSEVMYHPQDFILFGQFINNTADEFIELHNLSMAPVPLHDPSRPTNTWTLRDAVEYDFPPGTNLAGGAFAMIVPFDPRDTTKLSAFRTRYSVALGVPVFGPWRGDLNNAGDSVELRRPGTPTTNGLGEVSVPSILVERVRYSDGSPWPGDPGGIGFSLQRIVEPDYGNDPSNWVMVAASAAGSYVPGATPPSITSQPGNQTLIVGSDALFVVTATGTAPLLFQWRFNAIPINGAVGSVLALSNVQAGVAGVYSVLVYNSGGSAVSTNFTVSTRVALVITAHPQNAFVQSGRSNVFSVTAQGTGTLRYQWKLNGVNIGGATGSTLTVLNAQATSEGAYTVAVSDDVETVLSNPAQLTIVYLPVVLLHPVSTVALEGGSAAFSLIATGTPPLNFRWRTNGVTFVGGDRVFTPTSSIVILSNLLFNAPTNWTCVVTNVAGQAAVSPPNTAPARLLVLKDMDGDLLADNWETNHPGFDKLNPADGLADTDGDGLSNGEEFLAGTDYLDPADPLEVELLATGPAVLRFTAVSNHIYTVQFTDGLNPALWQRLTDVLARTNTRPELVIDPTPAINRIYRLITPPVP